jgi:hypothetical protein
MSEMGHNLPNHDVRSRSALPPDSDRISGRERRRLCQITDIRPYLDGLASVKLRTLTENFPIML